MIFCELFKKVESLSKEYDELYKQAVELRDKWNLCGLKGNTCIGYITNNNCCKDCKFLGDKGCTTDSLSCRIYYCECSYKLMSNDKMNKWDEIKIKASKFHGWRATKFDSLYRALIGKYDIFIHDYKFEDVVRCCELLNISKDSILYNYDLTLLKIKQNT